jgi:CyaY protein
MIDEVTFRRESDAALDALEQSLIHAEEEGGFETEKKNGVLNTPVRQVWISAISTSFKLEWNEAAHAFTLPKTGEDLRTLTERLLREQLQDATISLK